MLCGDGSWCHVARRSWAGGVGQEQARRTPTEPAAGSEQIHLAESQRPPSVMADADDDLEAMIALGAARRPRAKARNDPPPDRQDRAPLAVLPAPADEEADDLAMVIALAGEKPKRKYEQSSWELCAMARAAKAQRRTDRLLEAERHRRQVAESSVEAVATHFPGVAGVLGIPRRRGVPMDEGRATIVARLAFSPAIRGESNLRKTQSKAAECVANALVHEQKDWLDERLLRPSVGSGASSSSDAPRMPAFVCVVGWQWDETSQRIRSILQDRLPAERLSHHQTAVQSMVQTGLVTICDVSGKAAQMLEQQPWLCKATSLQAQTADAMLEGMLRQYPIPIEESASASRCAEPWDFFLLSFTCDRAAANFRAMEWLWEQLCAPGAASHTLPFLEPCAAHGVSLMKSRPATGTSLVSASHTLSGLMRTWRFTNALRESMTGLVRSRLRVVREPMPASVRAVGLALVRVLYGDETSGYLHRVGKDGSKLKTQLYQDLEAICMSIGLSSETGAENEFVHYCFVEEGSPEHRGGRQVGAPCCDCDADSAAKLVVPVLNFLVHRGWDQSAASRWTYMATTFRKMAIGYLAGNLLPQSLRDVQVFWRAPEGLEASLERQIAADANDFQSRTKLRLLRACRQLCPPSAAWQLGVQIVAHALADALLYDILGDGDKPRACLRDMLDTMGSPLASIERGLLELVEGWSPENLGWNLFRALGGGGGRFDDEACRRWARQLLLQLLAAVHDVFIERMSRPPYSLFKLCDSAASEATRDKVVHEFFAQPSGCQSLFCRRLRSKCPNPSALREEAPAVLDALSLGTRLSIDFCERLHAQVRLDLRSSGRARSATASANRVICQQARKLHAQRTGVDPAKPQLAAGAKGTQSALAIVGSGTEPEGGVLVSASAKHAPKKGGNPFLEWRNSKLATFKTLRAPSRRLTSQELADFNEKCKREWPLVSAKEREQWGMVWRASAAQRAQRRAEEASGTEKVQREDHEASQVLWRGGDPLWPIPLRGIVAEHQRTKRGGGAKTFDDPALVVAMPIAQRASSMQLAPHRPALQGCCANKKSVCRFSLPPEQAIALNALCARFSHWVDSIGFAIAREAEQLLLLRGRDTATGQRGDFVVLLLDCRGNPKMQRFGRCVLKGGGDNLRMVFPEVLPAVVSLAIGTSRISELTRALVCTSSDDLCMELLATGMEWEFVPLSWRPPLGAGNLLEMEVTGFASAPLAPPAVREKSSKPSRPSEMDALALFDGEEPAQWPTRASRQHGAPRKQVPASSSHLAPADATESSSPNAPAEVEAYGDEDGLEGLAADELEAIASELAEAMGVAPEPMAASSGGGGEGDPEAQGCESGQEEEALKVASAERGDDDPPEVVATPKECADQAEISPMGYISCPLPPFNDKPAPGRLTTWPATKPLASRSVSVRCYMHPGCSSPAKSRRLVEDSLLVQWLFSAKVEPGATRERQHQLAKEHKELFKAMLAEAAAQAATSAGQDAATAQATSSGSASAK